MLYKVSLSNVPDGAMDEWYLCTKSNGDGSAESAHRMFGSYIIASRVAREVNSSHCDGVRAFVEKCDFCPYCGAESFDECHDNQEN